jgi:hypothetical protein
LTGKWTLQRLFSKDDFSYNIHINFRLHVTLLFPL